MALGIVVIKGPERHAHGLRRVIARSNEVWDDQPFLHFGCLSP